MNKCNLEIDIAKCMSCQNCVVATKDEYSGNEFPGYSKPYSGANGDLIVIRRHERGTGANIDVNYIPMMCNHCDDAPCVKGAGDGSIFKREDGVTMVNLAKSEGRRELVKLCPYGAIRWNEEYRVPQLWSFDVHLLDLGFDAPRCVDACPTKALVFHRCTDEEMRNIVAHGGLEVLNAQFGTKPRVYYRNLHLYAAHFIGGTVTATLGGKVQNVAGAEVLLHKEGASSKRTGTDDFGYFRFDGIGDGEAGYSLEIECAGFAQWSVRIGEAITDSVNLDILLEGGR